MSTSLLEDVEKILDNRPTARKINPSPSNHTEIAFNGGNNSQISIKSKEGATDL